MPMTDKEKQEFKTLYDYVKKLMGYDDNQALSRDMILRLKGLSTGQYMANNKNEKMANYSIETVYHTFVFCSPDIKNAFRTVPFKDENHKFNYMLKIVHSHLNDVYEREKSATNRASIVEKYIDNELRQSIENSFVPEERKERKTETIQDDWW